MAAKRRKRIVKPRPLEVPQEVTPEVKVETSSKISNLEDATELVKKDYRKDLVVDYIVLENGNVFYGNNRNPALKYAARFDLKYFEVKLK